MHLKIQCRHEPFLVDVIDMPLLLNEPALEEIFAQNGVFAFNSVFSPME